MLSFSLASFSHSTFAHLCLSLDDRAPHRAPQKAYSEYMGSKILQKSRNTCFFTLCGSMVGCDAWNVFVCICLDFGKLTLNFEIVFFQNRMYPALPCPAPPRPAPPRVDQTVTPSPSPKKRVRPKQDPQNMSPS